MTTIAANLRCMAADRKVTDSDCSYETIKIRRIGDAIVGCAGENRDIARFVRWLEGGAEPDERPKFKDDAELEALVLTPAGLFIFDSSCMPDEVTSGHYAVGTGKQAALSALRRYKATPKGAVEAAASVDPMTGGPVDVLRLR